MPAASRARFVAAAAALTAAALARPANAQPAAPPIRVGATANDTYAEAYYGQELGTFKKAGLAVEITTFTAGGPITTAVAGGAIDIGIAGATTLANAVIHGIPFAYIAPGGMYSADNPASGLIVANESTLRAPKDFDGKTIAVGGLGDTNALAVMAWLDAGGLDPARVRFIEIAYAEMGPALTRGTVAAAMVPEPSLTRSLRGGGVRILSHPFDVYGPRTINGGWFARADYIKGNAELVRRYVAAIYEVARWANAHTAESGAILAKVAKLDDETVKAMVRSRYGETLTAALFQSQLDVAFKYKVLERHVAATEMIAKP